MKPMNAFGISMKSPRSRERKTGTQRTNEWKIRVNDDGAELIEVLILKSTMMTLMIVAFYSTSTVECECVLCAGSLSLNLCWFVVTCVLVSCVDGLFLTVKSDSCGSGFGFCGFLRWARLFQSHIARQRECSFVSRPSLFLESLLTQADLLAGWFLG